jgi:hypothetical protein
MTRTNNMLSEVRVEVVTTTFVASGRPEGIHDLGRLLEMLNNPVIARQIELTSPSVRPLYRAAAQLQLEAALLVRRDDIVFANFDGPYFARGAVKAATKAVPLLLMAPPFQISGAVEVAPSADGTQALRSATQGFFVVHEASVFDADGHSLGEGSQIIVNGAAVQMTCATRQHIEPAMATPAPRDVIDDDGAELAPALAARAA